MAELTHSKLLLGFSFFSSHFPVLCVQWGFLFFEKSLIYVVCRPLTKTKMGLFLSLSPFLFPLSLSLRYLFFFSFFKQQGLQFSVAAVSFQPTRQSLDVILQISKSVY